MPLTIDEVHEAIHEGIRKSSNDYARWSDGWTLADSGVEGLVVARIAAVVYKRQSPGESLLLELPYSLCAQWSGAKSIGRTPKAIQGNKRADIALFNKKKHTKYVIEVKRMPTKKTLHEDLERLCTIVHKCAAHQGGTLMRGFMAIFHAGGNDDNIQDWISSFNSGNANAVLKTVTRDCWKSTDDEQLFSICVEVASRPSGG